MPIFTDKMVDVTGAARVCMLASRSALLTSKYESNDIVVNSDKATALQTGFDITLCVLRACRAWEW